jgi:hypothetical protein
MSADSSGPRMALLLAGSDYRRFINLQVEALSGD